MAQTLEAIFYSGEDQSRVDYTPGSTVASGEVVLLGNGFVGICTSPEGIAANTLGSVATAGNFKLKKAPTGPGPTFAVGVEVGWDNVGNTAVAAGTGTFDLGICIEAAVATDDHVKIALNRATVD